MWTFSQARQAIEPSSNVTDAGYSTGHNTTRTITQKWGKNIMNTNMFKILKPKFKRKLSTA